MAIGTRHLHDRAEEGPAEEVGFRLEHYRDRIASERLEALYQTAKGPFGTTSDTLARRN